MFESFSKRTLISEYLVHRASYTCSFYGRILRNQEKNKRHVGDTDCRRTLRSALGGGSNTASGGRRFKARLEDV